MSHNHSNYLLILVFFVSALMLFLPGCGDSGDQVTAPATTIGPAGGSVTDGGGASVTIPPGALAVETNISVENTPDPSELPFPVAPASAFAGAARFGPAGQEFDKPVLISIPLAQPMVPGTELALFVFDETLPGWRADIQAVVADNGLDATAEVTHFSLFIIMGDARFWFGTFRRDFFDICYLKPGDQMFQETVDLLSQAFTVGGQEVFDFSAHSPGLGYDCYEITGLSFLLTYTRMVPDTTAAGQWVILEEGQFEDQAPPGSINMQFLDQEERLISDETCGEYRLVFTWDFSVVLECQAPALTIEADDDYLEAGDNTVISAFLFCGETPFDGQDVTFEIEPSTGIGQVNPWVTLTNGFGLATVMFESDLCLTGKREDTATITSEYTACSSHGSPQVIEDSVDIRVEELLTGDWAVEMQSTTNDCDPPDPIESSYTAHVIQTDNSIWVDGYTGQINGDVITWSESYPEEEGWTTEFNTGIINEDGSRVTVTCDWEYVDYEVPEFSCSGRDILLASKICTPRK